MTISQATTSVIRRLFFTIMLASPAVVYSQTAIIEAGKLAGFDDIGVGGMNYNVRFIVGSFNTIFGDASGLDFTDTESATAASRALLAAFEAHPTYDADPTLTRGCASHNACIYWTPYDVDVYYSYASARGFVNRGVETGFLNSITSPTGLSLRDETPPTGRGSYADWTHVTAIPVPAAIWLMGTGLLGLFGYSRRKVQ